MSKLHDELIALKAAAESMPAMKDVGNVIRLVSQGAPFDQLFFEKLNDPSWLPILDRYGYYSNLPGIKAVEGGGQVYPYHLPLIGLARLAEKAPQAVTGILAKLELPENPTVGDQVLRCVASIREPSCIPVLHPLLVQLGEKPNSSSWVWIEELLKNWIEIKAFSDALIVINSYLLAAVGSLTNRSPIRDEWLVQQVDRNTLERLTPQYPLQIATIVFNALSKWAEQQRREQSSEKQSRSIDIENLLGDDDLPCYWLEDFKTPPTYRELEGTLACRLFLAAEHIFRDGDTAKIDLIDQLLRSNSWNLFRRLRWQLYADFPQMSLGLARRDVLERIPYMNQVEFAHNFELAQLLQVHAKQSGDKFLSSDEVNRLFDTVLSGPLDRSGALIKDHFMEVFRRMQLWPISPLLQGERLATYRVLAPDSDKINIQSYKPFRSGIGEAHFVQHIPPPEGNNLKSLNDQQLWDLLNNWQTPSSIPGSPQWWIREDVGALAKKFAELVESEPQRFLPVNKWWENLKRPEPLSEPLNRATERIQKKQIEGTQAPTENDWANWFGIAKWIISQSTIANADKKANETAVPHDRPDWYWSRIVVSNFLIAVIQSDLPAVKPYLTDVGQLLKALAEAEDLRLQGLEKDRIDDWLTTAINTVRGHAIEAMLKLALRQKNAKEEIQPWIFQFICSRLSTPEESPAIFALIGANLRLFVFLFTEKLKETPDILFPQDRPFHRRAAVVSHFCFDHPMTAIIETFPQFLDKTLSIMESILAESADEDSKQKPRDFASQVGIHIAFYYWNNVFKDEDGEAILDHFFALAHKETRAFVIRQIAWIFDKAEKTPATSEGENIFRRVMKIWDRRYEQISEKLKANEASLADYEGELGGFINWLECECFPFEWRFTRTIQAIGHLKMAPETFHLLETLYKWENDHPERLEEALQIFAAILKRPSDQLRWSIQAKKLGPLLVRGMNNTDPKTQAHALECRDLLLKLGLFEFLELSEGGSTKS